MIVTNLTQTTLVLSGVSKAYYDIAPSQSINIPNGDISDVNLSSLISQSKISVTGWSLGVGTPPEVTAPFTISQTVVTLAAGVSAVMVPANATRRYLSFMVTGANDVTVAPGAGPAVAGAGIIYQAQAAGKQGASQEFPNGAPTNAFSAISTLGSTITVWEGV